MSTSERRYQRAFNIEPPDRVLWAALREHCTAVEFAAVEAAYSRASQRYQRACRLNQMARWVWHAERSNLTDERNRAKLEERRAILREPLKYIEGE